MTSASAGCAGCRRGKRWSASRRGTRRGSRTCARRGACRCLAERRPGPRCRSPTPTPGAPSVSTPSSRPPTAAPSGSSRATSGRRDVTSSRPSQALPAALDGTDAVPVRLTDPEQDLVTASSRSRRRPARGRRASRGRPPGPGRDRRHRHHARRGYPRRVRRRRRRSAGRVVVTAATPTSAGDVFLVDAAAGTVEARTDLGAGAARDRADPPPGRARRHRAGRLPGARLGRPARRDGTAPVRTRPS